MKPKEFDQQIAALRRRIETLGQLAAPRLPQGDSLLKECLEELHCSLEELQVADDELRQQNAELIATREQVLAEQRRFQELFDLAPEAYLVTDPVGKILQANQAATVLLNLPHPFILNRFLIVHLAPEDCPVFRGKLAQPIRLDQVQEWEAGLVPRQGQRLEVVLAMVPIRHFMDNSVHLLWIIRNITERKAAEQALRQARDELELRVQERTATLAEKNEKLRAEISARERTEQQLKDLNQSLDQRIKERAAQLSALTAKLAQAEQQERRRLAQMLHDHLQQILLASRLKIEILGKGFRGKAAQALDEAHELLSEAIKTSQNLTAELSPPILHEAGLLAALDWLARWMQEKHRLSVQIKAEVVSEPVEQVRILLFMAIRELLLNVVKHANVNQATVQVNRLDNQHLQIIVADSGAGFDPTHRKDAHALGSGFGLFTYRERLELLGGGLEVDSAPGRGTRITLLAPTTQGGESVSPEISAAVPRTDVESKAPAPLPQPRSAEPGKIRVLLADDHKILRQGLVNLLRLEPDLEVIGEASDGQMALEMARRLQPDVVVMDISMPRLNGIEATRTITAELPRVRVIGLSMHEKADMAAAMRQAGASAYLTKDGPSDLLVAVIRGT